jgi:metal-responsive CopG/Arc/MetJ family transcriptional regulator
VAKVMISLPDELLARVDAEANRSGRSRSAVLREFASEALDQRSARLAARMRELNGRSRGHGGNVVAELKSGRPT